jgi:hypothetical protein
MTFNSEVSVHVIVINGRGRFPDQVLVDYFVVNALKGGTSTGLLRTGLVDSLLIDCNPHL